MRHEDPQAEAERIIETTQQNNSGQKKYPLNK
jgi:hypothetical protein